MSLKHSWEMEMKIRANLKDTADRARRRRSEAADERAKRALAMVASGEPLGEVARLMGIRVSTVRSLLRRL